VVVGDGDHEAFSLILVNEGLNAGNILGPLFNESQ